MAPYLGMAQQQNQNQQQQLQNLLELRQFQQQAQAFQIQQQNYGIVQDVMGKIKDGTATTAELLTITDRREDDAPGLPPPIDALAPERERLAAEVDLDLRANLAALVDLGALDAALVPGLLERIELVDSDRAPLALACAELVFEGLPETLDAKREAFALLSRHCPPDAILTSTTSSKIGRAHV